MTTYKGHGTVRDFGKPEAEAYSDEFFLEGRDRKQYKTYTEEAFAKLTAEARRQGRLEGLREGIERSEDAVRGMMGYDAAAYRIRSLSPETILAEMESLDEKI